MEDDSSGFLAHSEISILPESLADVQFVVNNLEPGGKVSSVKYHSTTGGYRLDDRLP